MTKNCCIWIVLILGVLPVTIRAQDQPGSKPATESPARDSVPEQVIVDYSDLFEYIQREGQEQQRLIGNVELRQDSIYMYCDSATIVNELDVTATGNVIIQQGDSISIFADSLLYKGDEKVADLYGNVVLTNGRNKLFTDTLNYDLNTKVATYHSGALLTDDTTQLRSVHGYYYVGEDLAYFKDSVVVVHPDFELRSDTLKYQTRDKRVTFLGPTLITQGESRIYCESGNYDLRSSTAEFRGNAQYRTDETLATADSIRYEGDNDMVFLLGNARFEEEESVAIADRIRYDEVNEIAYLEGNAEYRDADQEIRADSILYDRLNEFYATRGRSRVSNPPQLLTADLIDFDKVTGLGLAVGDVIWQDTTEGLTIVCERADYDNNTEYLQATGGRGGRPLLITEVESDSLFLSADTLISYQIVEQAGLPQRDSMQFPEIDSTLAEQASTDSLVAGEEPPPVDSLDVLFTDSTAVVISDSVQSPQEESLLIPPDTTRLLLAYYNVRMYKSNLQAVCDSLTYDMSDSVFYFFRDPVVWSDTSQFSADTIVMQMANDEIDRIFLHANAFILNSPDEIYFNQVKGREMIAHFDSSELRRMTVEGNAESVYYALDEEDAYLGVNKTLCSEMLLYFGNNQVLSITFYSSPQGTFSPMRQADHNALRLPGFNWRTDRRPRSPADL